jgi:hypothetical protein
MEAEAWRRASAVDKGPSVAFEIWLAIHPNQNARRVDAGSAISSE